MKKTLFIKPFLVVAGVSLLATGCVVGVRGPRVGVAVAAPVPVGEVVVNSAPPEPVIEGPVGIAPDPAYVWIGGAYIWRGGWVWEPGHWTRPPHPGALWVGPHYAFRGGRHVWVRGYWH